MFKKPNEPCPHCGFKPITTTEAILMLSQADPTGKREIWLTGYEDDVAKPLFNIRLDKYKANGEGVVYINPAGTDK